ncbi:hypothetical protein BpHYR1_001413 [Brachionus plicatilis]|uniref:Uncharacterized protein n=1 Tax=Brachionus plicatilis TaxID=10195 RepID=A0A3M7RWA9_BRAPC|nr:hypothetical protein BpHYR1_001413 [Brachionus plicatilis]
MNKLFKLGINYLSDSKFSNPSRLSELRLINIQNWHFKLEFLRADLQTIIFSDHLIISDRSMRVLNI